ncbi:MAG: hypothetical protein M1837_004610 [Sclerophora amabilis]|nr:MAG: hypothetical protein M1837_004610 [Sclerophora amabilis]
MLLLTAGLLLATIGSAIAARPDCSGLNALSPRCKTSEALHRREYFYVGGRYEPSPIPGNEWWVDAVYVEKLTPQGAIERPNPIVFFHGGGTSAVTWLQTPDNRKGFASYFLDKNYVVYLIDVTSVGRSSSQDLKAYPLVFTGTAEGAEEGFTAPEIKATYPQATGHTQWPGNGTQGDPAFDAFLKGLIPLASNSDRQELSMRDAGCDLLRIIGPSFLVSHSIGAEFPILLSDECPDLIAGNINLEPTTIPFSNFGLGMAVSRTPRDRPWGLTSTKLNYDPPAALPGELETEVYGEDKPELRSCVRLKEPARKLPNINKVPYVALTGDSSVHITWDHCIINYLKQVGGKPEWIKLGERGIKGNGHFLFLEENNLEIADVVFKWMKDHVKRS